MSNARLTELEGILPKSNYQSLSSRLVDPDYGPTDAALIEKATEVAAANNLGNAERFLRGELDYDQYLASPS